MFEKRLLLVFVKVLLVITIFFLGIFLRVDDYRIWEERQNLFFLKDNPLFTSYDAYLFARYARLEKYQKYKPGQIDPLRFVPDNFISEAKIRFPDPIPQLSWLAAKMSAILGFSVEKWAYYVYPILACLFIFPLFYFFERLGYVASGFLGGLVGVSSLIYLVRTSIARFDTDALNLFYPACIAFFLLFYFRLRWPYNIACVFLAAIFGNLFYWWYPAGLPIIFSLILAFLATLFFQRKFKLTKLDIGAFLLFLVLQIWFCWKAPLSIIHYVSSLLVGKSGGEIFSAYPNVLKSISELQKSSALANVVSFTLPSQILWILGIVGFLLFLLKQPLTVLFAPLFLIGLLVFKSGNRFGMFLAPFLGVGLGFWIHFLWELIFPKISHFRTNKFLTQIIPIFLAVVLAGAIWYINKDSRRYTAVPKILAPIAQNFETLKRLTPSNAWIWTWWDSGYAISFLGERGVFIDGGSQTTPKTYYVALSFTTSSAEEAYNIISFITNKGLEGLKEKLMQGIPPSRLTALIKKGVYASSLNHPVYWLFTGDLPGKFAWIGYFGNWSFEDKKGKYGVMIPLKACRQKDKTTIFCKNGMVNLKEGYLQIKNKRILLKELVIQKPSELRRILFREKGLILESVSSAYGRLLYVVDEKSYLSNFNQMFILRRYDPRYFQLVHDDFPYAVLYEVKGSSPSPKPSPPGES